MPDDLVDVCDRRPVGNGVSVEIQIRILGDVGKWGQIGDARIGTEDKGKGFAVGERREIGDGIVPQTQIPKHRFFRKCGEIGDTVIGEIQFCQLR